MRLPRTGWAYQDIAPARTLRMIEQAFREHGLPIPPNPFYPLDNRSEVEKLILRSVPSDELWQLVKRTMPDPRDLNIFRFTMEWWLHGRTIVYEDDALHEHLAMTDVHDIPPSEITVPFASAYYAFGRPDTVEPIHIAASGTGMHRVDGVYVSLRHVGFLGGRISPWLKHQFEGVENVISFLFTGLPNEKSRSPIDDATHWVNIPVRSDRPIIELCNEQLEHLTPSELGVDEDCFDSAKRGIIRSLHHSIKLLLYLSLPEIRSPETWEEHFDLRKAMAKARKSKGKGRKAEKQRRAMSQMVNVVYLPASKHMGSEEAGSEATGRSVAPHWRRGHFRSQACGPKLSKRKIVWIKPTLVNSKVLAGSGSGVMAGKIYKVGKQEQ